MIIIVRSIIKSSIDALRYNIFQILYVMHKSSIFLYIIKLISNFKIFFIFHIFIVKLFFTKIMHFYFFIWLLLLFLITSFFFVLKLIIFIAPSLRDLQIFFIQYLPLYRSCLFSKFLDENIVAIENPGAINSLTFVVNEFSGLFLHLSIY